MPITKESLLYIYPSKASFVNNDISFLAQHFQVKTQDLSWGTPLLLPINLLRQCWFLLKHARTATAIVVSFGGYFSLLPVLLGKLFAVPTLIVLNGTDCVSFPRYQYGSLRKPLLRFFIKHTYAFASKLLPVDASLQIQAHTFDVDCVHLQQGFQYFFPKNTTPVRVLPNGFDTQFWQPDLPQKATGTFITVAAINNVNTLQVKGIDLFFEAALQFPEQQFTLVGISKEMQTTISIPTNVTCYPFVAREQLKKMYQSHQFYMQLSINEGFGCALAEAMLCGCVPVVSNVGALPHVVGDTGFVISKRTKDAVKIALETVLQLSKEKQTALSGVARQRIVEKFPISEREKVLLQEIAGTF